MPVMNTVATLHNIDESVYNVAEEMAKCAGTLDDIRLKGQDVLCGVFIRPGKKRIVGAGGKEFIMHTGGTGKEAVEDVYQGKVLKILKLGPQAFNPDVFPSLVDEWGGKENIPKLGDWVFCRCNDGVQVSYKGSDSQSTDMFTDMEKMPSNGGWPCRVVAFSDILAVVRYPGTVV